MTSATDAVDILTAAIEGIGFRLAAIADQIEEVFPLGQITGSGGAFCGSPAIRQVVADILGRDIRIAKDCDASLRGAALHAALT
ncbi:FGGY-family carbohydrate kinase, partial [Escherichia coli]|nr:FGGY-family carbohydrate kinase [Escherichia coli]